MTHLTEEQLILYYYGEPDDASGAEQHIAACADCRKEYSEIQRLLNSMESLAAPERGAAYGDEVWRRLRPQLDISRGVRWQPFPKWIFAGAFSALLVLAFLAGRWTMVGPALSPYSSGEHSQTAAYQKAPVRERVLLLAVGDHLERSQRVLVELANAGPEALGEERHTAEDLLAANRLYRQAAMRDDPALASVLDDLERLLTDLTNAPESEWPELQKRMADQGILFKVRVIESNVRQREREQLPVMRY
jgi:hypothetical protein